MAGLGTAMYNGVSGLRSFSTAISVVSDNIANAGTTAFKTNEIRFADLVSSYYSTLSSFTDREGSGSYPLAVLTDWGQGPMLNTSKWSDLAINGEGFFVVKDAQENNFYTRDGGFYLNSAGELVNYLGYKVLDVESNPIILDLNLYSSFTVTSDGKIYGVDNTTGNMTEDPIATLGLVTFRDPNGLIRVGNNLYREGPNSGRQDPTQPGTKGLGSIMSYTIEGSNVDLSEELVNMVIYQANFNANSKVITAATDMLNTAINVVR